MVSLQTIKVRVPSNSWTPSNSTICLKITFPLKKSNVASKFSSYSLIGTGSSIFPMNFTFEFFLKIIDVGTGPIWLLKYWLYKCQNTKRIWGRTFIGLSIESLALILAVFVFSVTYASRQAGAFETAGAAIGGGIATIFIGILSFFFGAIMLIAGIFTLKSAKKTEGGSKWKLN